MAIDDFKATLDAAAAGGEWAWTRIYREFAPAVLGYLRARSAAEPEDLVGEVFVQLSSNVGTFTGDEQAFRSWVFMVAHNRMLNERRTLSRKPSDPVADFSDFNVPLVASTEEEVIAQQATDAALKMLEPLTPDQREVLALRVIADLSLADTARVMGKNENSVKQLQFRALNALRAQYAH